MSFAQNKYVLDQHIISAGDNMMTLTSLLVYMSMCLWCCVGREILVDDTAVIMTHAKLCKGKCTNAQCTHSSHKSRKLKRSINKADARARALAGFKPVEDTQFKNILQHKMNKSGMDM